MAFFEGLCAIAETLERATSLRRLSGSLNSEAGRVEKTGLSVEELCT